MSKAQIIAKLVEAGHEDLAEELLSESAMMRYKVVPTEILESDPDHVEFFETLLKKRVKFGYDKKTMEGAIDLPGSFGDMFFTLSSNDDTVYLQLNEKGTKTLVVKYSNGKLAAEAAVLILEALDKADHKSS